MQTKMKASSRQYGAKKRAMRRTSTLRLGCGLSGLNMLDHIKWTGGPPPSIRAPRG